MALFDDSKLSTGSLLSNSSVPESFICPITRDVMVKPVLLVDDGQTYEEEALKMWLKDNDVSPVTHVRLRSKSFQTNYALKELIENYEAQRRDGQGNRGPQTQQVSFQPDRQQMFEFLLRHDCDQYFDRLIAEGFSSVADLCRITMPDLLAMDFGRGHAHRLREAIQKHRRRGPLPEFRIITPGKVPRSASGTPLTVNILLLGDVGVGKTSLRKRLETGHYHGGMPPTQGVELTCLATEYDGEQVQITLWDPAGQERFASITKSFFRRAHAAVVVFAADEDKSWKSVEFWLQELEESAPENVEVILVCNKSDLLGDSLAFGDNLIPNAMEVAREKRMSFFMTSAKSGDEVTSAFQELVAHVFANDDLLERILHERDGTAHVKRAAIKLERDDNPPRQNGGCCSRRLGRG